MAENTRVRQIIRDTFLSLMVKKGFNRISVKDILDASHVSKSGFYFHFEDKYDLLKSIEDEFLDELRAVFESVRAASSGVPLTNSAPHAGDYYAKYFECIARNQDLFLLLLSEKGGGNFIYRLTAMIEEEQKKTREVWGAANYIPMNLLDYYTAATSYSYVGAFIRWAQADPEERPSPQVIGAGLSYFFTQENIIV